MHVQQWPIHDAASQFLITTNGNAVTVGQSRR